MHSTTAVVILNWNGRDFLEKFLPTLLQNTADASIVVVDNCSTDDSVDFLQNYPSIEVIENASNGGFAKGYNDGLKELKGRFDYYVLLNSDVEVSPNWLTPLVTKMDQNSTIAGAQPKILSYHKKTHFEHAGACGGFMDKNHFPFCRGRIFDEVEEDNGQYDTEKEVFWSTGACMIVRASVYHELGGLDEDFFAHMEEIDFCWRAKKQGYSFYVLPQSKVYHVGGGTLNYESPRKTYLNFRNSLLAIYKNYDGWRTGKLTYRFFLDGVATLKMLASFQFRHAGAVLKAHLSYYRSLPKLRKKRKIIRKQSTGFNTIGLYNASIVWAHFFKGVKTFSGLNKRFFKRSNNE